MGANSNLPQGASFRGGERGAIFYRIASSNIIDGGISPTFPDSMRFNTTTTLDISGDIDDCHYIYKADVPSRPSFGDAKPSGLLLRLNITDSSPGTSAMTGFKGLTAYQMRDMPSAKGAINISNDSITSAPSDNYINDYLVYSDTSKNKKLDSPNVDYAITFEEAFNPLAADNVSSFGDGLLVQRDPFVTWLDVKEDDKIFEGVSRSKLHKYVEGDKDLVSPTDDAGRIYLKRKAFGAVAIAIISMGSSVGNIKWTPKDKGRGMFRNDPEWDAPNNHPKVRWSGADVVNSTAARVEGFALNANPPSLYVPDKFSLIKQTMEAQTFKATWDDADDNDLSGRDISFARLHTGGEYSMGGHHGLHMNSLWVFDDGNLPKYGNQTTDTASHARCGAQFTTVPLPEPIQLDSTLYSNSGGDTHDDIYSIAGRIDTIFKINEMPHMMAIDDANLDGMATGRVCYERGFTQLWHTKHPTLDSGASTTSITGHIYDYHTGMTYTDTGTTVSTGTNQGIMGIFIGAYQDKVYAIPMAHRENSLSNADMNWEANWGIAKHLNWYDDHAADSTVTQRIMIQVPTGSPAGIPNRIELPKGVFIRQSMIIYNPDDKYAVFVYTNATTGELYGVTECPNGFSSGSSDDADGKYDFKTQWPKYYTCSIQNTRFDLPTTASPTYTNYTEAGWDQSLSLDGIQYGENADSEISVMIDGIYGHGFMSDASNASTVHENAQSKGNIHISNHDIIQHVNESHRAGADGDEQGGGGGSTHPAHPFTEDTNGMEHAYALCRNTLCVGHFDYKAALGNNDSTWSGNEKAVWYFNDFEQTNFNTGAIDFGSTGSSVSKDWRGGATQAFPNWRAAFSHNNDNDDSSRQGRQISDDWMDTTASEIATGETDDDGVAFYHDGFSQKGAMVLDWTDSTYTFAKREHITASAKPIKVFSNTEFMVLKPELLKVKKSTQDTQPTFRLYKYNTEASDGTNYLDVKIMEIDYSTGYVKVDTDISGIMTNSNVSSYFISPLAYWVWFHFWNMDTSENVLSNRSYVSMFGWILDTDVSSTVPITTTGFTWNEFLSTDGVSLDNLWDIDYANDTSSIILDRDYGYGKFGDEVDRRKSIQNIGYIQRMPVDSTGIKYMNLNKVIELDSNLDAGDEVGIIVKSAIDSSTDNYSVQIGTSSHGTTTSRPQLFMEFFDKIPDNPVLKLKPYETDPFLPEFSWDAPEGDAWYGLLFVSEEPIYSQYHNAIMHLPMNNPDKIHGETVVASDIVNEVAYNNTDDNPEFTVSGNPVFDTEGLSGNCIRFDGNDSIAYEGDNSGSGITLEQLTTQATIHMHLVPDTNCVGTFFNYEAMSLTWNSDDTISLKVHNNESDSDHAYGSNYVELKSSNLIKDGQTPIAVTATIDTEIREGNVKLFINGELQDQTGVATSRDMGIGSGETNTNWKANTTLWAGEDDSVTIGQYFEGRIEEVVIYNKAIYPISPNMESFVFTKPLTEIHTLTGAPQNYTCKLFMKDYHNIRGSTTQEVAASAPISLRKTAFRLSNV